MTARGGIVIARVPKQYKTVHRFREHTHADQQKIVREEIGKALAGPAVGKALDVAGRYMVFHDEDELLAVLRAPFEVEVGCWRTATTRSRQHVVTYHPDGSVSTPAHPGVDADIEMTLGALGGSVPPCLLLATILPTGAVLPEWVRGGRVAIESRLRPLYAAAAWAQDPDTDWAWVREHELCDHGITPALLARWFDAGFTMEQAKAFWAAKATVEAALPWLHAGQVTKAAAAEAARGHAPERNDPWREAGFTLSASRPWQRAGFTPQTARALADDGFTARSHTRAMQVGMTPEEALDWVRRGVPAAHVAGWWVVTVRDHAEALRWSGIGVATGTYLELTAGAHPFQPMTFEEARDWVGAGFPASELPLLLTVPGFTAFTVEDWVAFRDSHPEINVVRPGGWEMMARLFTRAL